MRRKFSLKTCSVVMFRLVFGITIFALFKTILFPPTTTVTKIIHRDGLQKKESVPQFSKPSKYPNEEFLPERSLRRNELEDFTMHSLLDPKEQFDTPIKKFGEKEKRKVILLFNKQSFENEISTNEKYKTCEYNNCWITSNKSHLHTADALLFEICASGMGTKPPIDTTERSPNQAWIFKCGETPIHHIYGDYKSSAWHNTMNWSISYRLDSDMPHPYGYLKTRTVPRILDYESIYESKTKTALWVVSNCRVQSARDLYVKELMKHGVDVDIYGRCGPHNRIDKETLEQIIPKYKFYLGFENSLCNDYITEKFFVYYDYNLIVVVRGGADYDRLLPTKTYINTAHFPNVSHLAEYLLKLGSDKERYIELLRSKDRYEEKYEYGHKQSICELCRRLNNVSKFKKTYYNIRDFLENGQCKMPTDVRDSTNPSRFANDERVFNMMNTMSVSSVSSSKQNGISMYEVALYCFMIGLCTFASK
ncbi:alpha-(1,3)-fucosyltransferase fut-5-like [Mercenaria mercenaria]|uniref:alpha-(1,3)-fucosyltransferase fut-5-like n=1 Tax=Mercenaria mercenaria TaxID=6596 RepID=UPI00234E9BA9|nr:alpha-(1,3)-fucosyltransferase fut-5-like [Mercenaria mercenaria]